MSTEEEVREASRQFYAGLNAMANGDAAPLAKVWSHSATVTAVHPIGGRQVGWEAVNESFQQVAKLSTSGKIELKDQLIQAWGDIAYELGTESGQLFLGGHTVKVDIRVTNIYRREAGSWKMVHHQTDLSPAMVEVLNSLQSASKQQKQPELA